MIEKCCFTFQKKSRHGLNNVENMFPSSLHAVRLKANLCRNCLEGVPFSNIDWFCSKISLATVLIRSIFAREKFFQRKIERINTVARHVLL